MKKDSRQLKWWIFATSLFILFVALQIPASWLIAKFYKDNTLLSNVSGNIWQGHADWQQEGLSGSLSWTWRPVDLVFLRLGAHLNVQSGQSQLNGNAAYGFGKRVLLRDISGQIAPESLRAIANWQWPANPIQLNQVQFNFQPETGFSQADGQLHWGGGPLGFSYAERVERINIPSLQGKLLDRDGVLQIDVRDQRNQKMANFELDQQFLLNAQITQRFLLNMPSYEGKAALDSYVVSTRQPIRSGGF